MAAIASHAVIDPDDDDSGGQQGPAVRWRPVDVRAAFEAAAAALDEQALGLDRLDDLDDGDCGTNLASTMGAVVQRAAGTDERVDFGQLFRSVSDAPASGTSGLILVGMLAGWGDALANHDDMDGLRLALALEAGCDRAEALTAVSPTSPMCEVARAGAVAALDVADRDGTLAQVAGGAADAAMEALELTATRRPELVEAGVVDAGAAGWVVVLESVAVLAGGVPDEPLPFSGIEGARYEVSLVLAADDTEAGDRLASIWSALGDEIAVTPAAPGTWEARVATDDIGAVVEAAIALGRPSRLQVDDRVAPG